MFQFYRNKINKDVIIHHITILLPSELELLSKNDLILLLEKKPEINLFGFGKNSDTYYLISGCKYADEIRKKLNFIIRQTFTK